MRYKKITSPSNPLIKNALKGKKISQPGNIFIEGHRFLEMAVSSGAEIKQVFFTGSYKSKNERFLRQLSKKTSEIIETTEHILSKLSDTETPQGIVAVVSYKTYNLREL